MILPQHVKPFVNLPAYLLQAGGNKTDRHDALAICEAALRPELRCVVPRSVEQIDRLLAHQLCERYVAERTRLLNQMRGLLQEYGVFACLQQAGRNSQITACSTALNTERALLEPILRSATLSPLRERRLATVLGLIPS